MPRNRNKKVQKKSNKMIEIELVPEYESELEFQKRRNQVQDIISKMIILATTRGRSRKDEMENIQNAA